MTGDISISNDEATTDVSTQGEDAGNLTKREAYEKLLQICQKQGDELSEFLLSLEGHLDDEEYKQIRLIVGGVMGQGHYEALVAISNEIPELTPQWVKDFRS